MEFRINYTMCEIKFFFYFYFFSLQNSPKLKKKISKDKKRMVSVLADQPTCRLFVAVHVGAGFHSKSKEVAYRSVCDRACREAYKALSSGKTAIEAAEKAMCILEDDPVTNAGIGSNLTMDGTVECDASIMSGHNGEFGAIGAASGIPNPTKVAAKLLIEASRGTGKAGLIPPTFLAGPSVRGWCQKRGIATCHEEDLVSNEARVKYIKYLEILRDTNTPSPSPSSSSSTDNNYHIKRRKTEELEFQQDTVGVIVLDSEGNLASAVSSGGIALKNPGRIGEAAMYGCGCWAQNPEKDIPGICCSVTGTGEQIMKVMLAKTCAEQVFACVDMQKAIENVMQDSFLDSRALRGYEEKNAGIIALKFHDAEDGDVSSQHKKVLEFWFAHTTPTMGIGYMSDRTPNPKTMISRMSKNAEKKFLSSGFLV